MGSVIKCDTRREMSGENCDITAVTIPIKRRDIFCGFSELPAYPIIELSTFFIFCIG